MDSSDAAGAAPRWSWQLFGIPIRIHTSWFIVVAFVTWTLASRYFPDVHPGLPVAAYWVMGATAALLLFTCVLLHELGHSLVAKRHGIPVHRVTLFIFGGVAQIGREPQRPSVELKIALAGPLVSVLLAALCFAASALLPARQPAALAIAAILRYLALINTGVLLFNLLPGFPLDGGRVLRAAVWAWTGSLPRATRIASRIGSALGLALLALGAWEVVKGFWVHGAWSMLLGFFLRNAARRSAGQPAPRSEAFGPRGS